MKFTIDTNEVASSKVDLKEFLYLMMLYTDSAIDEEGIKDLHKRGYIIGQASYQIPPYIIAKEGINLVESVLVQSELKNTPTEEQGRFKYLSEQLRELFPTGRKPGTNLQWRDSDTIIIKRLKAFAKKYPDDFAKYSNDDIIEATERYISTFNGNYRYMQVLKYFIFKIKTVDGEHEETSQLLSFLENNEDQIRNDDWTLELR